MGQAEKCFNTINSCPVPADFNREELKDYFVIDGNITGTACKVAGSAYPFFRQRKPQAYDKSTGCKVRQRYAYRHELERVTTASKTRISTA